jgi:hypothetical protein
MKYKNQNILGFVWSVLPPIMRPEIYNYVDTSSLLRNECKITRYAIRLFDFVIWDDKERESKRIVHARKKERISLVF